LQLVSRLRVYPAGRQPPQLHPQLRQRTDSISIKWPLARRQLDICGVGRAARLLLGGGELVGPATQPVGAGHRPSRAAAPASGAGHGCHGGARGVCLDIFPRQFAARCLLHQRTSIPGLGPPALDTAANAASRAGPSFRGRAGGSHRRGGPARRRRLPRRARPGVGVAGAVGGAAALGGKHGQVVLLRLPTGPKMAALEKQFSPGFDSRMQSKLLAQLLVYLVGVGGEQGRRHLIEHKIDLLGDGNVGGIEQHGVGGAAQGAFGAGRVDVVALAQVFDDVIERYVLA
nr:hypothetical protein [Tanacetum cinerariifolium]